MNRSASINNAKVSAPRSRTRSGPVLNTCWGRTVLQLVAVIAFFAIWEGAARLGWVSNFLVGSPTKIYDALARSAGSGERALPR